MSNITFSDVSFIPQYSEITHRSQIDISSNLGNFTLDLPVISSNMPDITEAKMAIAMAENGGLGIIHRFMSIEEETKEFRYAVDNLISRKIDPNVGVSIGVQELDKKRFDVLYNNGAKIFCIDIAHGHHILMRNMIEWIRKASSYSNDITIIGGNVATVEGAKDIIKWGANICKAGIGPGSCCETRRNTGVGVPQLHALEIIREALPDALIIADGGIKWTGDVPKALYYANAVMVGKILAGTIESPGHVYEDENGNFYKVYGGSSSGENKVKSGQENKFVEGHVKSVPFRGHVKFILRRIKQNTQSSFSYSGANNIAEFKHKAKFCHISSGARKESKYE